MLRIVSRARKSASAAAAFAALALLGACASGGPAPVAAPGPPWTSSVERDHPLAGRIWQPAGRRFVDARTVLAGLETARFVLLGEKHDNPDHHRIQAWLLDILYQRGRRPALAFEMLTTDQEAPLREHLSARPRDGAGIAAAVAWDKSGWPDWALYRPIAQAALDRGAPLLPASLPRPKIRDIVRHGLDALGSARVEALGLDRPPPPSQLTGLRQEIVANHCDMLPESMIDPMVQVTLVKDAEMAATLVRGAEMPKTDGAVLIGGNGHVRADRGVPWHLARLAPSRGVATVGLIEVQAGETDPTAYAETYRSSDLPFGFVWFTPRLEDTDPCEKYREQLRRAGQRHSTQQND